MSAPVVLNLLNNFGKELKCKVLHLILDIATFKPLDMHNESSQAHCNKPDGIIH